MPITILIIVSIFVVLYLTLYGARPQYPYVAQKTILTKAEAKFYETLRHSIPQGWMIAPKVRLADVITCSDRDWTRGYGPKISSKHIDFILYDAGNFEIKLGIELDDQSHNQSSRRARDEFVNEAMMRAGGPLLRIKTAMNYDVSELQKAITDVT